MKTVLTFFAVTLIVVVGLSVYDVRGSNKRQEFAATQGSEKLVFRTEGLWDRTLVIDADPEYDPYALADLMTQDSFLADQLKAVGFTEVRVGNITERIR